MSVLAQDLMEFIRLYRLTGGALIEHMLQATALNLIAEGVADEKGGL